jgi:hypothetical protein
MNRYHASTRRRFGAPTDPIRYVARRLSSLLIVASAIGGIVVAGVLDVAGLPTQIALAIGLVVFAAAATVGTARALREPDARSSEVHPASLPGWADPLQLGPDSEQVVGRRTGARA